MWQLGAETDYKKKHKKLMKRYRRESKAVHNNLDTFFRALCAGAKPQQIKLGFIHPEPSGVLAIDQKGGGSGLKEIRLYTYPDESSQTLYLITIGEKNNRQSHDINYCREWVADFLKQNPSDVEPTADHH